MEEGDYVKEKRMEGSRESEILRGEKRRRAQLWAGGKERASGGKELRSYQRDKKPACFCLFLCQHIFVFRK